MALNAKDNIIKVEFLQPPLPDTGQTEFYFGPLSAIYEMFTPKQIGCRVERLWQYGITPSRPKQNKKCIISKHVLYRLAQKK